MEKNTNVSFAGIRAWLWPTAPLGVPRAPVVELRTIDQGIEDVLPVLLNQIVNVSENSAVMESCGQLNFLYAEWRRGSLLLW